MRLFVSVNLPDDLAESVRVVQDEFREASGLNFTDPEQAHMTLKFLGEVDRNRLPAIEGRLEAAVDAAAVDPFEVQYGGLGVFPSLDYISVLWFGVRDGHGDAELTRLAEAVEDELVAEGFDPADHDFTPHVTLARMNHAGGKDLVQENVRELDPTIGTAQVSEIRLTKSELTDKGPIYSTVERFPV
ncbi:MAG: 2'-5' RNA ligase [Halobacteriales archaeon]|jgi:2'-5' RNA ligase